MATAFDKIFLKGEKALDDIMDKMEKQLHQGMRKVAKKILNESAPMVEDGNLKGGLKDAQKLQKKVEISTAGNIEKIKDDLAQSLTDVESVVKTELEATGIPFDDTSLDVLKKQINTGFSAIADESMAQVGQLFYDAMLTGMEYSAFIDAAGDILGGTDPDFFIRNAQMNFYQEVHLEKAREAGLDEFLYYGNVQANTRAFCRERVGKVYSKKEIDSWAGDSWKGKSCHPMICRGGYNCRHHWRPVRAEWVKDGKITVRDEPIEVAPVLLDENDIIMSTEDIRKSLIKKSGDLEKKKTILKKERDEAFKEINGLISKFANTDFDSPEDFIAEQKKISKLIDSIDKKGKKSIDKIADKLVKIDNDEKSLLGELIGGTKKIDVNKIGFNASSKSVEESVDNAIVWFNSGVTNIDIPSFDARLIVGDDRRRAYANYARGNVREHIGVSTDEVQVAIHEMGHVIEFRDKSIYKKTKEFLKNRTKNDEFEKLSDLFPDLGYEKDEITKKDKFSEPYSGKYYKRDDTTEIFSMGVELLYTDSVKFAKNDPEYFNLMVDILRGV